MLLDLESVESVEKCVFTNAKKVHITPPNDLGLAKKGDLCFDAAHETGNALKNNVMNFKVIY